MEHDGRPQERYEAARVDENARPDEPLPDLEAPGTVASAVTGGGEPTGSGNDNGPAE